MEINGRQIGISYPPYVIAEMSGNHNGDIENAFKIIRAAKGAYANAVKLQCYDPYSMAAAYTIPNGPWAGRQLTDLYKEAHTPREWFPYLFDAARNNDITIFSSVFDREGVDFLEKLDCPAYKISSFDIVDLQLIRYAADTGKPLIISTGMASDEEVMAADDAIPPQYPHIFLHCVSGYPTPLSEARLARLRILYQMTTLVAGLSDHSLGHDVAIAAVALGAPVIEKHLTLDRMAGGPDSEFSMEPQEFLLMTSAIRAIWDALHADVSSPSEGTSVQFRKSLFVSCDVRAGERLSETSVQARRPNLGVPVASLSEVCGKRAIRDLSAGNPLLWDDLAD